mmetsp:Transcript_71744/g.181005  ORF Transcript_71744/g.181005 Transcript_71744/m.181005 type:complete len:457 (+) Transcript_71744:66-1436(+)
MGPRLVVVNDVEQERVIELLRLLVASQFCSALRATEARIFVPESPEELRTVAQVQFKVQPTNLNHIIKLLQSSGYPTFDVLDVVSTTEHISSQRRRKTNGFLGDRFQSTRDRLSTLEIHNCIVGASHITFDHCFLIFVASCIATVGLLGDSPVNILASFFVSPLMTMIMATTWGLVISDYTLVRRGLRNMFFGAALAFSMGLLIGTVLSLLKDPDGLASKIHDGNGIFNVFSVNSNEVLARGPPCSATWGTTTAIATFSGITIALGYSNGITNALSGVTLAASLLPPLVNCGLMTAFGFFFPDLRAGPDGDVRLHDIAVVSGGMYVTTVICVTFWSYLTFKAKHIGGLSFRIGALATPAEDELGAEPSEGTNGEPSDRRLVVSCDAARAQPAARSSAAGPLLAGAATAGVVAAATTQTAAKELGTELTDTSSWTGDHHSRHSTATASSLGTIAASP